MESASPTVAYSISTTVLDIARLDKVSRVDKDGTQHVKDCGWFILLEGSRERLFLGMDEPSLQTGDKIRVTIEKEP